MSFSYGRREIGPREVGVLVGFVLACELVGIAGALATAPAIETWYATISKPGFTPPSWVFGPVWTLLYALMGTAAFLVWRERDADPRMTRFALGAFLVQLMLNGFWSPAFFGLQSPLLGLLVIVPLLGVLLVTTRLFARVSRPAAALLVPYVAWVTYATVLNAAIWTLN